MVKIQTKYIGEKKCESIHEPSGSIVITDAPKDNHGQGMNFSPTDLLATSLGTCILTTIAIHLEKEGIRIDGSTVIVEKEMTPPPRRIASLKTTLHFPKSLTSEIQQRIPEIAAQCPAKKSIHPDVLMPMHFYFDL